jgi:hypothetical protein
MKEMEHRDCWLRGHHHGLATASMLTVYGYGGLANMSDDPEPWLSPLFPSTYPTQGPCQPRESWGEQEHALTNHQRRRRKGLGVHGTKLSKLRASAVKSSRAALRVGRSAGLLATGHGGQIDAAPWWAIGGPAHAPPTHCLIAAPIRGR